MVSLIKKKLNKLLGRQEAPPSVETALDMFQESVERFEDLIYYVSLIKDFKMPADMYKYATRADFNLKSTRDELKIFIRTEKEKTNGKS